MKKIKKLTEIRVNANTLKKILFRLKTKINSTTVKSQSYSHIIRKQEERKN